jgi:hypothetical protein
MSSSCSTRSTADKHRHPRIDGAELDLSEQPEENPVTEP